MSNQNQQPQRPGTLSLNVRGAVRAVPTIDDADKKANTAAPTSVAVGETKFGKTILIQRTSLGRTFQIKFAEGGELPEELKGEYTRATDALAAVATYKARNPALRDKAE